MTNSNFWISDWMELLLNKIAVNNIGPTRASRWFFIASNCVYNSYQFVRNDKYPVDNEYWLSKEKGNIISDNNIVLWVENACYYFFPIIIRNYMNVSLNDNELPKHNKYIIDSKSLNKLKPIIDRYLSNRNNDGWLNTNVFNGTLPNGTNFISADNTIDQDLNLLLPHPNSWTPLKINGVLKNYLTPEWGTANKGVLNDTVFNNILNNIKLLLPSDDQYNKEMLDVQLLTSNLTDKQKITAEFWAGGPGTVTPPGMWLVFADIYLRSNKSSLFNEIKTYTIISTGLYQSSICAWRLKRDICQARPIQKIRELKYGNTINSWNGSIDGKYWLPYQELTFVTPPFPDFVSGHSTFSSSSSKLFCYLFGTDQINLNNPVINLNIINKLSPVISSNTVNFSLNNVFVYPGKSVIQANTVPSTGCILNWNSWSEMAISSGDSRLYGGIHVDSSNKAGILLGSQIADNVWSLLKNI